MLACRWAGLCRDVPSCSRGATASDTRHKSIVTDPERTTAPIRNRVLREITAVNGQRSSRNESRLGSDEIGDQAGDLGILPCTTERNQRSHHGASTLVVVHICIGWTRLYCVDGDASW